jgi:hypothetical protein
MAKTKKEGKPMTATILRLDVDSHKALKIAAALEGTSMHEVLTKLIEEGMERRGYKKFGIDGRGVNAWLTPKKPRRGVKK